MLLEGFEEYAIYMLDLDGRVASWNMGAQRIEGYKAEEIIGKHFSCFFPPRMLRKGSRTPSCKKSKRPVASGRISGNSENTALFTGPIFCWRRSRTIRGRLYGIAKVNHDMTLYKAAQEEIRRLNSTLEQRVRERTAATRGRQQGVGNFQLLGSHDLRAPLRHIDGFADMLRQRASGSSMKPVSRIWESSRQPARQMSRLIDALLAFSRMGRAALNKSLLDVNKLVRGVLHDLSYDMEGRNIEWRIETLPQVVGIPALLRQVWFNLISNSLKYSRVRDVATIEIGLKQGENEVTFFIKDNGGGFSTCNMWTSSLEFSSGCMEPESLKGLASAWLTCGGSCSGMAVGFGPRANRIWEPLSFSPSRRFHGLPANQRA